MRSIDVKSGLAACVLVSGVVVGCASSSADGVVPGIEQPAVATDNGLRAINGLNTRNGLTSINGLRTRNGLSTLAGLDSTVGLMTTAEGRDTVSYLVRCALSADQSIIKQDQNGVSYTFNGQIGIAPEWADGECNLACQESVSACLLAHVNTSGVHIPLWLVGNMPGVGWGLSGSFPNQEGSFFGNIFTDPPTAYYCNGEGFDQGVVPGRIGADQPGAPYVNPFASVGGACKTVCTPQDIPNQVDGYKACYGFNHVITVWRADSASSETIAPVVTDPVTEPTNATTSYEFDPNATYKICNVASGKCLDYATSRSSSTATVVQKTYAGAATQKWSIVQVKAGQYKVVNANSNKVVDTYRSSTSNGTDAVQATYRDSLSQLWTFVAVAGADGTYHIGAAQKAGVVLAIPSTSLSREGQVAEVWALQGGSNAMAWTVSLTD